MIREPEAEQRVTGELGMGHLPAWVQPFLADHNYWIPAIGHDEILAVPDNNNNHFVDGIPGVQQDRIHNPPAIVTEYFFSADPPPPQPASDEIVATIKSDCNHTEDPAYNQIFYCHFCDTNWKVLADLMKHLQADHPYELEDTIEDTDTFAATQYYSCIHCCFITPAFGDLITHAKSSHTSEKEFSCSHCEFKTKLKGTLKEHMSEKHMDQVVICMLEID